MLGRRYFHLLLQFLFLFLLRVNAKSATGDRVLVIHEEDTIQQTFSQFFGSLKDRGYELSFLNPKKDTKATLTKFEERLYDHLVVFPQKLKALGSNLTPQILVEFVNDGGNVLLASSSTTSESLRDFCRELDIDLPPRDSYLADHFSYHPDSTRNHTLLILESSNFPPLPHIPAMLSSQTRESKIVYRGAAHGLGQGGLLLPIVRGTETSYVFDGKEDLDSVEDPYVAGKQGFLVSGFQARNNARVIVTSSLDMFSDEFYEMKIDGKANVNKALADDLTKWAFHETLVLKSNYLQHSAPNSTELNPAVYRVSDPVRVTLSLSQYNPQTQSYLPFHTPSTHPIQLEVNMLDPYIRTLLPLTNDTTTASIYSKEFMLPDHYGVFNFKVTHRVPGYTYVYEREQFTIRHRQHNEYPRFITGAWSYYAGWMTVSAGFVVFCTVWLWHTPSPAPGNRLKKAQ